MFQNLFEKGRWIYGDKKRLEEFLNNLQSLIGDLRAMLVPLNAETRYAMAMMADEDLEFVADDKALRLYLEEATRLGNDDMADSARRGLILSKLSLKKTRMDSRLEGIEEAYKDTLKWALGPKDTTTPKWDHLPTWAPVPFQRHLLGLRKGRQRQVNLDEVPAPKLQTGRQRRPIPAPPRVGPRLQRHSVQLLF